MWMKEGWCKIGSQREYVLNQTLHNSDTTRYDKRSVSDRGTGTASLTASIVCSCGSISMPWSSTRSPGSDGSTNGPDGVPALLCKPSFSENVRPPGACCKCPSGCRRPSTVATRCSSSAARPQYACCSLGTQLHSPRRCSSRATYPALSPGCRSVVLYSQVKPLFAQRPHLGLIRSQALFRRRQMLHAIFLSAAFGEAIRGSRVRRYAACTPESCLYIWTSS